MTETNDFEGHTIEVRRSSDGEFYYVRVAKNGEDLYASETFKNKSYALAAADEYNVGIPVVDRTDEE